jgi:uncharacterized membrane protein YgcG
MRVRVCVCSFRNPFVACALLTNCAFAYRLVKGAFTRALQGFAGDTLVVLRKRRYFPMLSFVSALWWHARHGVDMPGFLPGVRCGLSSGLVRNRMIWSAATAAKGGKPKEASREQAKRPERKDDDRGFQKGGGGGGGGGNGSGKPTKRDK